MNIFFVVVLWDFLYQYLYRYMLLSLLSKYVQALWLDQAGGPYAISGPNSLENCQTAFQISCAILHIHCGI